jgi:hypothetical protein
MAQVVHFEYDSNLLLSIQIAVMRIETKTPQYLL